MTGSFVKHSCSSRTLNGLAALFILTYPAATLVVHGAASAMLIAASVISLGALLVSGTSFATRQSLGADRVVTATCIALASPLVATLVSEWWHGKLVLSLLDSPSRFVAALPIMFALCRLPVRTLMWSDLSFAIGAIASLLVLIIAPQHAGDGRLGSSFLDAIHFGDIALVLGVLSALSLNWWRKDDTTVRFVKLVGLLSGLYASVLTGSRGGWLAIPVIAVIVVCVRGREKSRRWRLLIPLAVLAVLVGSAISSAAVQHRILMVWSDLSLYSQGHKDTSIGIRLQLYDAAITLMRDHLVFGLGPNGFANSMQALADAGKITAMAAQLGRGETHNQMLAYAANYGIVGALAGIALHLLPCLLFVKYLRAPAAPMRRAALLGLIFVVSFWIFGLTVETFDLKMVASFYGAIVAILASVAVTPAASTMVREPQSIVELSQTQARPCSVVRD